MADKISLQTMEKALQVVNDKSFDIMALCDLQEEYSLDENNIRIAELAIKKYKSHVIECLESYYFDRDPSPPKINKDKKITIN